MTCKELLEQDKEKITTELEQAPSPEKAEKAVSDAWERVLYRYQESEEDKKLAESAVYMIRAVQTQSGLVDTAGSTKIWNASPAQQSSGKRFSGRTIGLLIGGITAGAAAIAVAAVSPGAAEAAKEVPKWLSLLPVVLETIAAVLLILAGRAFPRKEKKLPEDQRVEIRTDAEKVYRSLILTALVIDQNLEQKAKDLIWEKRRAQDASGISGLDAGGIELMGDLLEAAYSHDGEYALEKASDVRYFLHQQGVELVDWSEETAQLFDRLPSDRNGTIRPALVKDGRLLKKGLAGGGL